MLHLLDFAGLKGLTTTPEGHISGSNTFNIAYSLPNEIQNEFSLYLEFPFKLITSNTLLISKSDK